MLITVDFVMGHEPCSRYTRKRVASLLGSGKTLLECLRSDAVPAEDRIWLATLPGACSERAQRLFACWCAEQVLPLFEAERPGDDRPRMAIQVAAAYAMGEATKEELFAACDAAWASACDTTDAAVAHDRTDPLAKSRWSALDAASDAAWAAYDATRDTAWTAHMRPREDAARSAKDAGFSRDAQVAAFIELLETHGE